MVSTVDAAVLSDRDIKRIWKRSFASVIQIRHAADRLCRLWESPTGNFRQWAQTVEDLDDEMAAARLLELVRSADSTLDFDGSRCRRPKGRGELFAGFTPKRVYRQMSVPNWQWPNTEYELEQGFVDVSLAAASPSLAMTAMFASSRVVSHRDVVRPGAELPVLFVFAAGVPAVSVAGEEVLVSGRFKVERVSGSPERPVRLSDRVSGVRVDVSYVGPPEPQY